MPSISGFQASRISDISLQGKAHTFTLICSTGALPVRCLDAGHFTLGSAAVLEPNDKGSAPASDPTLIQLCWCCQQGESDGEQDEEALRSDLEAIEGMARLADAMALEASPPSPPGGRGPLQDGGLPWAGAPGASHDSSLSSLAAIEASLHAKGLQ